MFEAHVLHLLRRYLGEYVHGLSAEALRISVWKGDVVLKDLKIKAEALNSLRLPVMVKAGFIGTITLKVPWKSLGKEPVIVLIDRVFILAHPARDSRTLKKEDQEKLFEAKLQQIEAAELATLEAISRSKIGNSASGSSWLTSLIATIIGNLKISVSNVHIRYEDSVSNPAHPFACGVTLSKLAAVTMDEQGNETFDTSGALDKLRKSLQLERLAMYHDSDRDPWNPSKKWEDLIPKEWIEIFEDGIKEPIKDKTVPSDWARDRKYVVSPINGVLKYHRLGDQERNDPNIPFEKASVDINDFTLTITETQYHDWIRLMEVISRYKMYAEVSHLRPMVPVSNNARLWWRYGAQAGLQLQEMCYRFSWDQIQSLCHLRRRYIQLYVNLLQQSSDGSSEIRDIEKDLDPKVILLWRFLAHAKVETVKSKEAAVRKMQKKNSWFSLSWRNPDQDSPVGTNSEGSHEEEEKLTKEEWDLINKLLSFQPDNNELLHPGKEGQNMIRYLIEVFISKAATRIISNDQKEIVCGTFENLQVSTKFKHSTTSCDVTLKFYGLSSPEGSLAESVCSEQKVNALAAQFVHSPAGENVDWKLSATISPCHVTIFVESYYRLLEFVKRSNAVSPTVALETATALQHKFEKVTRKAQEQIQMVLEEHNRFALDIDLDAPKVRIPIRSPASSKCDCHLLLDFGHFTLNTKDIDESDQSNSLYSRFYISGRDIAALFTNCGFTRETCSLTCQPSLSPNIEDVGNAYALVDPCGMAVVVDKIKVLHPKHPSMRVSVQVPGLSIHFSPSRLHRIMELLNILNLVLSNAEQDVGGIVESRSIPWNPADLATAARVLVWKGIGYSIAAWQPCFLVLSGLNLYVLESEASHGYQRCSRCTFAQASLLAQRFSPTPLLAGVPDLEFLMSRKQVFEVPAANVGGSPSCLAVSARGMDYQKALKSFSTLIIEFSNEEEKATWLRGLAHATYRVSASPSVNILGDSNGSALDLTEHQMFSAKTADLVVSGTLLETRLLLYGKVEDEVHDENEEACILDVLACGGKVHVSRCEGDLTAKMKLHSLKIKDELQKHFSTGERYLACSVLSNEQLNTPESHAKNVDGENLEEDDVFRDALPDFVSLSEATETAIFELDNATTNEVFYEVEGPDDYSDFVTVIFLTRDLSSFDYDGIDTQMSIRMSKLEFFCNRPTLVALISLGVDLSSACSVADGTSTNKYPDDQTLVNKNQIETHGHDYVKGLLGYGKGRVIFNLNMNVDCVTVFLNHEDGSQLAMLVQESFLLDIKVHPSSIAIEGTLGNFRLCDLSLGSDHCWGWLCDIRDQGAESLIQFIFKSYSTEDDDYEGYDYSLTGRLSAVRIVFLYRFIQEVTAYFMGLATPRTEEAIKLVDKVGGLEWLIEKYEIDGAPALKLDLALDTPIIVVPRNSMSKDFMQLDLGHLRVKNQIQWHGSPEKDPSSVHIDVLDAEIIGINLAVGINGCIGKPMIREGKDIHIYVRRSLRDVFRKVPTFSLEVKVGLLHLLMSDKEYKVILDCLSMNLFEKPTLPPSFRGSKSVSKDTIKFLTEKVNLNGQVLLSRTVNVISVEIDYAMLELRNGGQEESPLAHLALEGLWVSYRMTSLSEADLYITIPNLSFLDIRPDTRQEMRLMLGSSTNTLKPLEGNIDLPMSTMFLVDCRWRLSSQSFVLRIQQPRILVVPDFLLAVAEFFVPALGTITGREEKMNPKNDPLNKSDSIIFLSSVYKQIDDTVHLSSKRKLVADSIGVDEYIYDGCGKTLCLNDEKETKGLNPSVFQPIIIIGRGKRLRFVNVKIENGWLLRKYTYMSSDSSYSVSPEDGVELLMLEISSFSSLKGLDIVEESPYTSDTSALVCSETSPLQSLSFEAQVVSPELTFYDSSKSFMEDGSLGEKLLRAKLDLSFMYASKEKDKWIRGHMKDLTIEAGSGLVILDPVDISGGYTSIKDKTNISLMSTDIYIHLSLGAISLLLNLQSQAATATALGNADPLSPCTNFDRIWVSSNENGPDNKLTFWRPRAPPNYVILGDCVTSRPIAPSQAVVSVNNAYGRVRKPLGFNLIGSFPSIQKLEGDDDSSDEDGDCSLWLPIAPPGYVAVGCVACLGFEQPPHHIVYCIRSDLVTSSMYSECILSTASNSSFVSGFSIWRMDNALGSFYAHSSLSLPPKDSTFDVNYLLLNSSRSYSIPEDSSQDLVVEEENQCQQTNDGNTTSPGWDILRSVSKATNFYMSTPNFERIWWDRGGDYRRAVSIWRPVARPGYSILGDCITEGLEPPSLGIIFKTDNHEISAKPIQFAKIAHIGGRGLDEAFFWYPVAPPGYASMGCVVTRIDEAPRLTLVCCPRMDLVSQANILEMPITRSSSSKASSSWSIWKVENQACTFLARGDLKKPSGKLAFAIGDTVKQKTRDNVTAELKIRCFSLTVLDSLCGMMTPLFDVTIANLKLATHGRPEAMNAVLISSIAASTFNAQLEAWEPLVESFDGIFKFETSGTNLHTPSKLGKRLRVAATSILNINLSAANLETFVEALTSWKMQREIEEKAMKLNEEANSHDGFGKNITMSALDEDDLQNITIENKLGCDVYLRKAVQNSDTIDLLHDGDCAFVWIPPPRYSDRLNVADESKESRKYVSVQIVEAKALPVLDDGNGHYYFCAVRLVIENQDENQQKLFPQSARTKCVKPSIYKVNDLNQGRAKWNEIFFFEVPRKGTAKLEVEVTNLAAKAGKGEVVGAASFSVAGHGMSILKKVASVRMLHHASGVQNVVSYPLKKRGQVNVDNDDNSCGHLSVSASCFERKMLGNVRDDEVRENDKDDDIGFWLGLAPEGAWESVKSFLPSSVITKSLNGDFFAVEVFTSNGKKHAVLRGLISVINDSDVKLDISVSHLTANSSNSISVVSPDSSVVLPWKSITENSNCCLQVRPHLDGPQALYGWGCPTTLGEQSSTVQGSLGKQGMTKEGNKMPVPAVNLNMLEKKDMLLSCSDPGGKMFWLSVGTDASVLHTEYNSPVYDWKMSISSPLKLENRLPCPAQYIVWERLKDGNNVKRQHGYMSSRETVHLYSVDVRNPIYFVLIVEGGWTVEKDPILVLDLTSNNHVSSFSMVNQQRKRRLRVSIERDMGGSAASPKIVRFFVPYWICNESSLDLVYRVVEIEQVENVETDHLLSRVRSTKSFKNSSLSISGRQVGSQKNIQILEAIEETGSAPCMLSPQDYVGRGGVLLFSSKNDAYLSPRVGVTVAIRNSDNFSPGISLLELEKKQRVDLKAFGNDGSYILLSALLHMTSDRTKVVRFQPHTLFINRLGCRLYLRQCGTESQEWIEPTDLPKQFAWQTTNVELLKLRLDDYEWSAPFSVGMEGSMSIFLKNDTNGTKRFIRVEVRSGTKSSRYEVIFRPYSYSTPYRIENRSLFLAVCFRQVGGTSDSWQRLLPNAAVSFSWEDLGRERMLELLVDGMDPMSAHKYNIDEPSDHQQLLETGTARRALCVRVVKEEKMHVVKVRDWISKSKTRGVLRSSLSQVTPTNTPSEQAMSSSECEFHVIVEIGELGLSIVDNTPEEILYFSIQNLLLSYSTGLGSGISRIKIRMRGIQVDNQLPLTPTPVLFRPQRVGEENDYILKFSMTQQSNGLLDMSVYPYIGLQGPDNSSFLINIHEPIIWRIHGMIQHVNISRLFDDDQSTSVSIDPVVQIGVLNMSEIRFKVSLAMSPTQRPVGVLGFWSSLMTALGNTENMPVRVNQRFQENVCMRYSVLMGNAITNIKKDVLSHPLQLLSGVDILGNASSALGHMSKGVAALSMDKKFIQSRQRKESKGVEDFGDVIREGGGAFAKGLFRGVTGILTKPLEGAKASGVEGFVQGVGKGLIGAAAQPVSGVLDLLSKTTEGANAMRMKIAAAIASEDQLLRRRLPRAIGGDNLLRPYDECRAQGQVILQLAECGSFFGQVDLFKVRGKFALSDAYEDHFSLPKGRILLVTHRRVVLLQQSSYIISQKRFNPARDPCSVLWDVLLDDLATMELTHGKKDHPNSPPSRLCLYIQNRPLDSKDQVRVIKCSRDSSQAFDTYTSIEKARSTYGTSRSEPFRKPKVTKPYAPSIDGSSSGSSTWTSTFSPQHLLATVPNNSSFGSSEH